MFTLKIGKELVKYNDGTTKKLWFCQMFRLGNPSGSFIYGTHHHKWLAPALWRVLSVENVKKAFTRSLNELVKS